MRGRLPVVNKDHYSYGQIKVISTGEGANMKIGAFCSVASNVVAMLGGHHRTDVITTYPFGSVHEGVFDSFQQIDGRGLFQDTLSSELNNQLVHALPLVAWIAGPLVHILDGMTDD